MAKSPKPFIFRAWFISQLRRLSRKYPPFYTILNNSKEVYYIPSKKGKQLKRVQFQCVKCKNKIKQKDMRLDHIVPVTGKDGFPLNPDGTDNWNEFIKKLYCDASNLQILCKPCHDEKSLVENKERRKLKKSVKKVDKKKKSI